MGTDQAKIRLRAAVHTDVGVVREHNEDSAHVDPESQFFIVADGMGGHAAGEVASAMAVDTVRQSLEGARAEIGKFATTPDDEGRKIVVALLENAVRAAHQAVFQRGSRESDKQGMGTTLDVVLVAGPEAFVAHVGDSRTYLIRDGRAAQITTDHTVAEVLVIEGKLSLEEAQVSPLRTILVNAIGVAADVGVELAHLQLRRGDKLLLCSDGLHDYFPSEQELADRLGEGEFEKALIELVELAKDRGGHDNITGVVVNVDEVNGVSHVDTSDGTIDTMLQGALSDGVPATIERDDTLPVVDGEDDDVQPLGKKKRRPPSSSASAGASASPAAGEPSAVRRTQPMNIIPPSEEMAPPIPPMEGFDENEVTHGDAKIPDLPPPLPEEDETTEIKHKTLKPDDGDDTVAD
jgi:serine/threonine protein phosphatase PrpC